MKYVVATVVIEANDEIAASIDAQVVTLLMNQYMGEHPPAFSPGDAGHVIRSIVTKCYTLDEAQQVSRRGAP